MKKEISELFIGIINQAKSIHYKHECGESENLIYMAQELRKYFMDYIEEEKKKLNEALDLIEKIL